MRETRAFSRHVWPPGPTCYRCATPRRLLKNDGGRPDISDSSQKEFRHGCFPCRAGQCCDSNAARPSRPSGPGSGFEEGHGHPGQRGAGAATGPAVGHERQPGHAGQHDGVGN
jgi:hypothetical protein